VSKDLVDRYISIYDDLSGSFEKYVRILVFINKTIHGSRGNYKKIKEDSLGNNVNYLMKQPLFLDLIEPFNVTIRNAIAHRSFLVHPISECITFIDTNKTIERKYGT
jgi:hypothetical protein